MEQIVHSNIEVHDRFQLEFKYDYEMLPSRVTRYKVVTYLFVPRSLDIHAATYPSTEFYRDLKNYVRLKTPAFSLAEIADLPQSPLGRAEEIVQRENWVKLYDIGSALITNFKFLRAILKNALDDCLDDLKVRRRGSAVLAAFHRCLSDTHRITKAILARYRALEPFIKVPDVDARVIRSFTLTDESISLVVEEAMVDLIKLMDQTDHVGDLHTERAMLVDLVETERLYRRARHFASVLEPQADKGEFLFRLSALKKFTSNVLFLRTATQREGTVLEQILFALAAGVSMLFATIIAFYFQQRYGNFTFPFLLALVVGYMFKDRIKESMRGTSSRLLRNVVYQRRTQLTTLDGSAKLGYIRERVSFVAEEAVPVPVMTARNRNVMADLDNDGQGETVIRYEKVVVLHRRAFHEIYRNAPGISAVKDIMRFDIRAFLRKMDEPVQRWSYLNNGTVEDLRLPKVYFLNFVHRYETLSGDRTVNVERVRATLTRRGLVKVQTFP